VDEECKICKIGCTYVRVHESVRKVGFGVLEGIGISAWFGEVECGG